MTGAIIFVTSFVNIRQVKLIIEGNRQVDCLLFFFLHKARKVAKEGSVTFSFIILGERRLVLLQWAPQLSLQLQSM
jgi:hypothetical protein